MAEPNPHDKLFKATFSNKEVTQSLILDTFPKELVAGLDFGTLKLANTSFIDKRLKEHFADIVYTCVYKGKQPLTLALLLEHKSQKPQYPHLQLIRYMLNGWEENAKQKQPLRPIIPVILYHGEEKWYQRSFHEYFKNTDETLRLFIPQFDYLLTNLTALSDERIRHFRSAFLRVTALLLKHRKEEDYLRTHLAQMIQWLASSAQGEEQWLYQAEVSIRYLIFVSPIEFKELSAIVYKISEFQKKWETTQ